MGAETPSAFLSYAHESDAHKDWVRGLAENLVRNGVETKLDQWGLGLGDDIGHFMEESIADTDYTILVCTENFARKADSRQGGAGYEQALIVGELLTSAEAGSRFLPVLRSGEPSEALPRYLKNRLFADFRDDATYDREFRQLLRRLFGAQAFTPPQLGQRPDFDVDVQVTENSGAATSIDPPGAWVLVAGTGVVSELDDKLNETCAVLGESLAHSGFGVVTGGWPGVDEVTARSFARALERRNIPLEDRLTQVVRQDWTPHYLAGNLVLVDEGEEEWTESVKRADVVVLIGGVGGTWTTGEYGLEFGRVVLPLADTGGDASEFYMHMHRQWKPEFLPGIDRSKFQVVAREAPQVVTGLVELLEEWKHLRAGGK